MNFTGKLDQINVFLITFVIEFTYFLIKTYFIGDHKNRFATGLCINQKFRYNICKMTGTDRYSVYHISWFIFNKSIFFFYFHSVTYKIIPYLKVFLYEAEWQVNFIPVFPTLYAILLVYLTLNVLKVANGHLHLVDGHIVVLRPAVNKPDIVLKVISYG